MHGSLICSSCIQWLKDTNLKANHNKFELINGKEIAVFNGSKILIWKQITTLYPRQLLTVCCIQWLKDTNLKANHNCIRSLRLILIAVFNGSKILIWKQITTANGEHRKQTGCIQWLKDTNLKANHNMLLAFNSNPVAVFNGSKILIWKQITT